MLNEVLQSSDVTADVLRRLLVLACYRALHYFVAEANIPCRPGYLRPERLQVQLSLSL
jgi:hypothetical protein